MEGVTLDDTTHQDENYKELLDVKTSLSLGIILTY